MDLANQFKKLPFGVVAILIITGIVIGLLAIIVIHNFITPINLDIF